LATGIARGFLAAFDTAWAIKRLAMNHNELELLCERESIYQLLSHTTHDNLKRNYQDYTIDPTTRYENFKAKIFSENQIFV
jgi:F-actin monooxygenase